MASPFNVLKAPLREVKDKMYRNDLIKGAMAEKGLRVEDVARESGLSTTTVSFIRSGDPNVKLQSLKAVAEVVGLTMPQLFEPKQEAEPLVA